MKSDLEKRLEYVRSQREILQRTEEELQKQLDAEKQEFDFKRKMPVGSVWLGQYGVYKHYKKTGSIRNNEPIMQTMPNQNPLALYHAHQIVKAAQWWNSHGADSSKKLEKALADAEQDGVLQNLE